ncbi:uncharacterized protein EV420DRAFT_1482015 [Desarmillaria tabescens]|uniref:Uncharacterized protein n=1 Tax=Armillaria tabescens TaxID=1929756 RepID=A0AA39K4H2_ARMTA|nr:uncharacterized protein EV420DRAFT_1482015 [Desarmillaria tabescens]KAK0453024.1 hypothetical protein EV420DRAFT_1482015 [Desarmillaria tabescens]
MPRPQKYKTQEERLQATKDKSKRYYEKHKQDISKWRKNAYHVKHNNQRIEYPNSTQANVQNTNWYEISPIAVTVPIPPPCLHPFPKLSAESRAILQEFEDFIGGKTPSDYVEYLLGQYFKDKSRCQGQIAVFVEPLDSLYHMRKSYDSITAQALQADGHSDRQKELEKLGSPMVKLIFWLEDIWHVAVDGPYHLCISDNTWRLAWQKQSK